MHRNAPLCTDACNTPVYYTPFSVHPNISPGLGSWGSLFSACFGPGKELRGLSCRTDSARIFPISRQKVAHRQMHWKMHRKTECFHRIFPPKFSPNFRCVFFCSKNSKCHRKTASKKFSQKIHRGTEQNPECRFGRSGSLSTCPFEKQEWSRKTENFFSLQFCTSLPSKAPPKFRNQEKGVLAKGVSVESSVTAKETKNTQGYRPQQYI